MNMTNAIELRGVSKVYGSGEQAVTAVASASLNIRQNEFFTLLGPSGCGKTTLLRLIAGFEFPTMGEILLSGQDIGAMPPFQRPINTVFQNYALFPHMSVADNIGFGLKMLGTSAADTQARVREMLKLVQMEKYGSRKTSQLSGGQQQRVALARALAPQPKVLLLDEPLSALDYKLRKEMQTELKRLQLETGITFVFVTHDQEEALTMSDRVAVMSMGNILQVGSPRDIYDTPNDRFVADFIGETNFLAGQIAATRDGQADVRLATGERIAASLPAGKDATGAVTVMVRPEHASIAAGENAGDGMMSGTLSNILYIGTDTYYNVTLKDGTTIFSVRQQNRPSQTASLSSGDKVVIAIEPNAARILGNG
jgi:spermidine/putrescine transport system ATP-binding protein